MPVKAIIFDFDGVILDSLDVKTQAFYNMYLPYGEDIAAKAVKYHLEHGGISRYEKFRHYHRTFLGREINDKQLEELAEEFSRRVMDGVIASPEVKGVRDFLEKYHDRYPMWVVSGTPEGEMRDIVKAVGMDGYFVEVYGSPTKKGFLTRKILTENNLQPKELVFVGDATTDHEAAVENNTHFILREHPDNISLFEGKNVVRIRDFTGFAELIGRL